MTLIQHEVALRRVGAALAVAAAVAVFAPRVGEPDRHEACAIGWIRPVQHWERVHARAHGGAYATLACLADPECAPEVHRQELPVDLDFIKAQHSCGYRIEFFAGPKAESRGREERFGRALTRFAVVAVPADPSSGRRAFCGDDRSEIFYTKDGRPPRVADGRCLDTSHQIR